MTHLFTDRHLAYSSPAPYWTYLKSPQKKKNFDAYCPACYALISRVTEPNLTEFKQGVEKWSPIILLKSKLWSSNPFGNANVTIEDRRQIAGESRQNCAFNSVNSEVTRQKFTKFGHNVAWLLPLNLLKPDLRSANPLSNGPMRCLQTSPIFIWLRLPNVGKSFPLMRLPNL